MLTRPCRALLSAFAERIAFAAGPWLDCTVWPDEREALSVWADRQLAAGHPLGEIVALNLRAREYADAGDAVRAAELCARAEARRIDHAEELLGPLVGELPRLRLRWHMGLVRAVHLDPRLPRTPQPRPRLILEVLAQLLRRPALRFVDDLQLHVPEYDDELERGLLVEIGDDSCEARPRRLILGSMARRFRMVQVYSGPRARARHGRLRLDQIEAPAERGLTWLVRWGGVQSLPWAPGDHGSRLQALERLLAGPWSASVERKLGRAMWDTSLRVRRRLIEALPDLPSGAAPLLLAALAVEVDARAELIPTLERALMRASTRPEWVAAIADNFAAEEHWVALWLGGVSRRSRDAANRAKPRLRSMLGRVSPGPRESALRRALIALGGSDPTLQGIRPDEYEDETIAELLAKIGDRRSS